MYLSIMYERRFNMWVILGGFRSWGHPMLFMPFFQRKDIKDIKVGSPMKGRIEILIFEFI